GLAWIDPVVAIAIALIIAFGTWGLFRESVNLVMDAVPEKIVPNEVRLFLCGLPGVESVHDLHVWAMSTSEIALTAHLVIPEGETRDEDLTRIANELHDRFGICHATLQIERSAEGDCPQDCVG
ncbi:MAG TPA: cation diffusion facilitator family transporter, partial [Candidatus Eisenbacteria bacterium]|nr:cation diffusion facilitator family transporter [Candidatus Eisenbacteria bacterium]